MANFKDDQIFLKYDLGDIPIHFIWSKMICNNIGDNYVLLLVY